VKIAPIADPEAEITVLGGVLVHPKALVNVGRLSAEAFYDPARAASWAGIQRAAELELPIDLLSVIEQVRAAGSIGLLGAKPHELLAQWMAGVVTIENLGYHAARLRETARRRRLQAWAARLAVEAADPDASTECVLEDAERGALTIFAREEGSRGPRPLRAVLSDLDAEIHRRCEKPRPGGVTGISTHMRELDEITLGFQPGELVILAARPSMGKSACVLNWLANGADDGEPGLLFAIEMRDRWNAERMVARRARVSAHAIRAGRLKPEDHVAIVKAMSHMSLWPLEIDDEPRPTLDYIRTTARHWRARWPKTIEGRIGTIVVDHLGLIESNRQQHHQNRTTELAEMTKSLKALARELNCVVVVLSQLNRSLESRADKRPIMSDLRESGAIEQDADLVIFLYREVVYAPDCDRKTEAEVIVGKQRNGPTGTAFQDWNGVIQEFAEPTDRVESQGERKPKKQAWHPYAPEEESD
jgi:replicative DNA helicase